MALQYVKDIHVKALCCRAHSITKAHELAAKYHVDDVYTDYGELLRREDIDFVYIGLVNSVHYEYSRLALQAGKNVIIEKPICSDEAQTACLVRLAEERHLYVFEAVTFLHAPFFKEIREALPTLGPVKVIQCNYSKYSTRYDRYKVHDVAPAFDPKYSGGALYDLNIYNLHFVISLFGLPSAIQYEANKGFNGIDTSGVALLSYPHYIAICTAAKDSVSPSFMMVQGESGWLRTLGSPDKLEKLEIHTSDQTREFPISDAPHRMVSEFSAFQQIYAEKDYGQMRHLILHSLDVIHVAETARHYAGILFGDGDTTF